MPDDQRATNWKGEETRRPISRLPRPTHRPSPNITFGIFISVVTRLDQGMEPFEATWTDLVLSRDSEPLTSRRMASRGQKDAAFPTTCVRMNSLRRRCRRITWTFGRVRGRRRPKPWTLTTQILLVDTMHHRQMPREKGGEDQPCPANWTTRGGLLIRHPNPHKSWRRSDRINGAKQGCGWILRIMSVSAAGNGWPIENFQVGRWSSIGCIVASNA